MKPEQLLDLIGGTDEQLLEKGETWEQPKRNPVPGILASAACLALVAGAGIWWAAQDTARVQPGSSELPAIPYSGITTESGYEGLMLHDISELCPCSPWTPDADLDTLPVFENIYYYQYDGDNIPADYDRMYNLLEDAARIAGISLEGLELKEDYYEDFLGKQTANENRRLWMLTADNGTVSVSADTYFSTRIEFLQPVSLPEGIGMRFHSPYEQVSKTADYFLAEYGDKLGMEQPTVSIRGGDYFYSDSQMYYIYLYDGSGDLTEQILSSYFDSVRFVCNDDEQLWLIDSQHRDRTHKLGDYPILTPEEAEETFLEGNFSTSVPEELYPETFTIAKTELVYRTGDNERYYMPYYQFFVKLNTTNENGCDTYGAFYVPAVEPQYLSAE